MARVNVPVTQVTRSGVAPPTPTTGDATNNHQVVNNGRTLLLVENTGSGSARTVTLNLKQTVDGQAVTPRAVSIPLSDSRYLGPFPVEQYGRLLLVDVSHAELVITALSL